MKNKYLLLSLLTPLFFLWVHAEDPHYEQLYSECSENLTNSQNSYNTCVWELGNLYETLSWMDFMVYNLYWVNGDNTYSIPLTNDIYLPNGYRAYSDSGVIAISPINSIENAFSIWTSDFQNNVIENIWVVYLFLFSCGLFLIFLYAIRRYFIWLKSIK